MMAGENFSASFAVTALLGGGGAFAFEQTGPGPTAPLHEQGFINGNPCFASGTRILTARGEIKVEFLRVNDRVLLPDRRAVPVIWIGARRVDCTRHPRPETVWPILIAAGALSDGVPHRDLVLSPDHALLLDEHLIPAKILVNGQSIRQIKRHGVNYYHVELPFHAVLSAEGALAESYLDTGNRGVFTNSAEPLTLYPNFAQTTREQRGCAPFAEAGPVVEAVRARLLARAGIETSDDPALVVERREDGAAIIRSRVAVPGHLTPDPRDLRRLGVKVASLLRADGRAIALDDPALVEGWHGHEADGRWTDGAALVPVELTEGQAVTVQLAASLAYPVTPMRQAVRG
jgi:hypothetical protein